MLKGKGNEEKQLTSLLELEKSPPSVESNQFSSLQENMYEQNRNPPPLLRLPAELRNRIYEELFGNRVIHIGVRDCSVGETSKWTHQQYHQSTSFSSQRYLKFVHTVCHLGLDVEDKAHVLSRQVDAPPGALQDYYERHLECLVLVPHMDCFMKKSCDLDKDRVGDYTTHSKASVDLSLLRACRQIYNEAALMPYATNTFAFQEGKIFNLFIGHSLLECQVQAIHNIQLSSLWSMGTEDDLRDEVVAKLSGLRNLLVAVHFGITVPCAGLNSFAKLCKLELSSIKVTCGHDGDCRIREKEVGLPEARAARVREANGLEAWLRIDAGYGSEAPTTESLKASSLWRDLLEMNSILIY